MTHHQNTPQPNAQTPDRRPLSLLPRMAAENGVFVLYQQVYYATLNGWLPQVCQERGRWYWRLEDRDELLAVLKRLAAARSKPRRSRFSDAATATATA